MQYKKLFTKLNDNEIVELVKDYVGVILDDEYDAYECDLVDQVVLKLNGREETLVKFKTLDSKHSVSVILRLDDYKICPDKMFEKQYTETEQEHNDKKSRYLKEIANLIEKKFGLHEKEAYLQKLNIAQDELVY